MRYQIKSTFAILYLVVLFFLIGCKKTEEIPTTYVQGSVVNYYGNSESYVQVSIADIPVIPEVKINSVALPFTEFGNGELIFSSHSFPLSPGDSVRLMITYTNSSGDPSRMAANLILPDTMKIIQIPDTLGLDDTMTVIWQSTTGAREYQIILNISLTYIDTSGSFRFFDDNQSYWVRDSLITLLPDTLFPIRGEVSEVLLGSYIRFSLIAYNGSYKEGDRANIKGDGTGFFYTKTYSDVEFISVKNP